MQKASQSPFIFKKSFTKKTSVLDSDVHTDRSFLHVRMLHRSPCQMTGDTFLEFLGILVAQAGVGSVDDHLLVETDISVVVGVIGAIHNDFCTLALAEGMFDGELAYSAAQPAKAIFIRSPGVN